LWKNDVLLDTFTSLSYDTIQDYNYASLGWSGRGHNALKATYQFVAIGRYHSQPEMEEMVYGISVYLNTLVNNQ
jgi:hypothetical protein